MREKYPLTGTDDYSGVQIAHFLEGVGWIHPSSRSYTETENVSDVYWRIKLFIDESAPAGGTRWFDVLNRGGQWSLTVLELEWQLYAYYRAIKEMYGAIYPWIVQEMEDFYTKNGWNYKEPHPRKGMSIPESERVTRGLRRKGYQIKLKKPYTGRYIGY
jgi:hypothetical protein